MASVIEVPQDLTDPAGHGGDIVEFDPIDAPEGGFDEAWLQEALRRCPDVLPVEEFGPVFHPLISIGREMPTEVGSIDNLFMSHAGYLVLVETKLWRNPEAKREVVAQLIDYAIALSKLTYEKLDELVAEYLRKYERRTSSLQAWVEERLEPVDLGFQRRVARNLKHGRLLGLVVTDHARPAVIDMLSRMTFPTLSMDVGVVELRPFRRTNASNRSVLLVPYVAGRTLIVDRSIVEVTVQDATAAQVAVRQAPYRDVAVRSKRISLKSEDAFWELMTEQAPDSIVTARTLIDKFRSDQRFALRFAEASIVVESEVPETEVSVPLFFLRSNGKLVCWIRTIRRRLRAAGLLESASAEYEAAMRTVLASPTNPRELARAVDDVGIVALYDVADRFVRRLEERPREGA
jgi:hypothetical protein